MKLPVVLCGAVQLAFGMRMHPSHYKAGTSLAETEQLPQKTALGCTCKTQCKASLANLYNCDMCRTEDRCGHWSLLGHWDWCTYPGDGAFESKTFTEKASHWWNKITEDTARSAEYPSAIETLKQSMHTSFENGGDEMNEGRKKGIHSIGSVCRFKLDISDKSPYTGLLGPGAQEGFIRMGGATVYSETEGLIPGLGFKFARTGVHSGNFVTLHSLSKHVWNFFQDPMSNHIAASKGNLKLTVITKKFEQASQCAMQVGLSDLAKYSQDGTEHNPPKFPFKLFMVPSKSVQTPEKPKTIDEVHAEMAAFPEGTALYTVYACQKAMSTEAEMTPTEGGLEKACGDPILLGDIVTTSKCTTSKYGDESFFFRHQLIEEDWQYEPSYMTSYDATKACGAGNTVSANGAPAKCAAEKDGMLANDFR